MANPKQPKLEKYTVADAAMGYSRTVWLQRGPAGRPQQLCLFLDGELYLDKMKAAPVLNALAARGTLPPMAFAFISHDGMKAREHDYTCNDRFGRFIAEKLVPWLEDEIPDVRPGQHLIGGLSLSGLAAAWLALQYPEHFPYCLCQSGSFWWNDEHFTRMAPQRVPVKNRFWLSVGDQETEVDEPPEVSQIVGVNHALHVLKSLGGTVHYHEYHGGHDMKFWREELDQALHWLLNSKGD